MDCPKCGQKMWDNRAKKTSGEFSPKSPDFSCKDKENCGHAIWPEKKGEHNLGVNKSQFRKIKDQMEENGGDATRTNAHAVSEESTVPTKPTAQPLASNAAPTSEPESAANKLDEYAKYSGKVFRAAWDEATEQMKTLMPSRDASDVTIAEWYDLKLRIAMHTAIEIGKIVRRERF